MANYTPKGKVITCILPKGVSAGVLEKLHEKGITRINFAYARGFDIHDEPDPKLGFPKEVEKEILTVICDEDQADEVFSFVYDEAQIGHLGGGLMYMSGLTGAQIYSLPQNV